MPTFTYQIYKINRLYRELDGLDNILTPARDCTRALKRLRPSKLLYDTLSALLDSHDYTLSYENLRDALAAVKLDYNDLFAVSPLISRLICEKLYESDFDEGLFSSCSATIRMLSTLDFDDLLAEVSETEQILLNNRACAFCDSDEETKRQYRDIIISKAKKERITETEAARSLDGAPTKPPEGGKRYFAALIALNVIFIAVILFCSNFNILLTLLLVLPSSEAAKQLCDRLFSRLFSAKPLYKLKVECVPEDAATLIVTTTLLFGESKDKALFDRLELAYLANIRSAPYSYYGMLCDLGDCDQAEREGDGAIIDYAKTRISELNAKYGGRFYLFIRGRVKSESEGKFMGRDRKRGAVIGLTWLLGGERGDFTVTEGDMEALGAVRYVITLDGDTRLGLGAVSDMVRTMTHPANKPCIKGGIVTRGIAIIQPRMETTAESCEASYFARMNIGGGDIYQSATFDLYQTLFGSGIFCGKGIFDVSAFRMLISGVFEPETILSHDALEGAYLNCASMTELALSDGCPRSPASYFDRLHRWIRGDVQALRYAKKPLTALSIYKLYDNIRRAVLPIFAAASLLFASMCGLRSAITAVIAALLYLALPLLYAIVTPRIFRRYRSVMSEAGGAAATFLFNVSSIFQLAVISADAVIRAAWRSAVSHRHTLQWVTASESDSLKRGGTAWYLLKYLPSVIIGTLLLIFSRHIILSVIGALWLLFPFICAALDCPIKRAEISPSQRRMVKSWAGDMWRYFAELVTERDNNLPPDNYQVSPSETAAHRTSPTNIGLYMLSTLAAFDMELIDMGELFRRLGATVKTVKQLKKWNGHLYNWYDTVTMRVIGSPYISTVDSGNFVVCLSILSVGLQGLTELEPRFSTIIAELDDVMDKTDFAPLYDEKRGLFHIGFDTASDKLSDSYYDLYMSEARSAVYFCAARGLITNARKAWRAMRRPFIGEGGYTGLASWTGTMFEYFMPSLFMPVTRGTLEYEALQTAVYVQRLSGGRGIWGKSESGYYFFDSDMNYQYKAFGAAKLGIRRGLAREKVYSPYSSFLTLTAAPSSSIKNLRRMERLGLYGRCGFYESVDFTPSRVGGGYALVRMYMSHHIGMSIIACDNFLCDNIMPKRFMSDPRNACASRLLNERLPYNVKFRRLPKDSQSYDSTRSRHEPYKTDYHADIKRSAVISNNKSYITATSDGDIQLYDGKNLLTNPIAGAMGGLRMAFRADGKAYELSGHGFSYGDDHISYSVDNDELRAEVVISVHSDFCAFGIHIEASGAFTEFAPLITFHPVMTRERDYLAHPVFCDLSVEAEYESDTNTLYYRRRPRLDGERGYTLGVTLLSGSGEMEFATRRDSALPLMYNENDILSLAYNMKGEGEEGACIIPFCAVSKKSVTRGKYSCELLITGGRDKTEAAAIRNALLSLRYKRSIVKLMKSSLGRVIDTRITVSLVSDRRIDELIMTVLTHKSSSACAVSALWKLGISGDLPVITLDAVDVFSKSGLYHDSAEVIYDFIAAHSYLTIAGIRFDMAIIVSDSEKYGRPHAAEISKIISDAGSEKFIGRRGGLIISDTDELDVSAENFSALYIKLGEGDTVSSIYEKYIDSGETVTSLTEPIRKVTEPFAGKISDAFEILRGGISIKKGPQRVPWSYIYTNKMFGTLVTQNSLGFTWFLNSREGRLSPWNNDILQGLNGERLIMAVKGVEYDLCAVSNEVEYLRGRAVWRGLAGGVSFTVECGVDSRLPVKGVICTNDGGCAVRLQTEKDVNAPTIIEVECGAYLICAAKSDKTLDYIKEKFKSTSDIRDMFDLYSSEVRRIFNGFTLESADKALDDMMNFYLPYQSVYCRIYARTGFYQSGGAYGFRDQLQDMLAAMYFMPKLCRTHIIRCCSRQYHEGDVMHWWHGGVNPRGVRTLCSDDMLWLPYVAAEYCALTGDYSVFEVKAPYLESEPLGEGERERYEAPPLSDSRESVYGHCIRAINHMRFGSHGLPLMGSCDWNDGMSKVGERGMGESVWLAFFYRLVLRKFSAVAAHFDDIDNVKRFEALDKKLSAAIEANAWDSDRYLRAYYDDGTPLGGEDSEYCKLDALPQAFSCIVDGGERAKTAADTAYNALFDKANGVYRLFTPPFGEGGKNPGYIRGYVNGVRENGGQYTHAAVWAAWGLLEIGENDRAFELLSAINPLKRYSSERLAEVYRTEPYALCGDVYYADGHIGRGGWSFYTGAAAWYYRIVLENMLGYKEKGDGFTLSPVLCGELDPFKLTVRRRGTMYIVRVKSGDADSFSMDGEIVNNRFFFDKSKHFIEITVAKKR